MRIVRALVLLLVVLNLLLFAAGRGYLGRSGSGEPERLTHQITPERIRIVEGGKPEPSPATPKSHDKSKPKPDDKSAPKPAAQGADQAESRPEAKAGDERDVAACRRYAPLSRDQAARIAGFARGEDAHVKVSRRSLKEPTSFWTYIPPTANPEDMDKHVGELKSAGISDWYVQSSGPDKGSISLGVFNTEATANVLKEQLLGKGVTGVRVSGRDSANAKVAVELTAKTRELEALTQQIVAAMPGVAGQACAQ